jgi:hypothetical protein
MQAACKRCSTLMPLHNDSCATAARAGNGYVTAGMFLLVACAEHWRDLCCTASEVLRLRFFPSTSIYHTWLFKAQALAARF